MGVFIKTLLRPTRITYAPRGHKASVAARGSVRVDDTLRGDDLPQDVPPPSPDRLTATSLFTSLRRSLLSLSSPRSLSDGLNRAGSHDGMARQSSLNTSCADGRFGPVTY